MGIGGDVTARHAGSKERKDCRHPFRSAGPTRSTLPDGRRGLLIGAPWLLWLILMTACAPHCSGGTDFEITFVRLAGQAKSQRMPEGPQRRGPKNTPGFQDVERYCGTHGRCRACEPGQSNLFSQSAAHGEEGMEYRGFPGPRMTIWNLNFHSRGAS